VNDSLEHVFHEEMEMENTKLRFRGSYSCKSEEEDRKQD
jgi:hypothetical protein